MSTLFKDSEKHQCFMARCTVSYFLHSVRCGLQGLLRIIWTDVCWTISHIICVTKKANQVRQKKNHQRILYRRVTPAPWTLGQDHDQVICLFEAHLTQILVDDAECVLFNKMGKLSWTRPRFKPGTHKSLVRCFTNWAIWHRRLNCMVRQWHCFPLNDLHPGRLTSQVLSPGKS